MKTKEEILIESKDKIANLLHYGYGDWDEMEKCLKMDGEHNMVIERLVEAIPIAMEEYAKQEFIRLANSIPQVCLSFGSHPKSGDALFIMPDGALKTTTELYQTLKSESTTQPNQKL